MVFRMELSHCCVVLGNYQNRIAIRWQGFVVQKIEKFPRRIIVKHVCLYLGENLVYHSYLKFIQGVILFLLG